MGGVAQFGEDGHTFSLSLVPGPCGLMASRCSFERLPSGQYINQTSTDATGCRRILFDPGCQTNVSRRSSRREPLCRLYLLMCLQAVSAHVWLAAHVGVSNGWTVAFSGYLGLM